MARERIVSIRNSYYRNSATDTNSLFQSFEHGEEITPRNHSIDITGEKENESETKTLLDLSPNSQSVFVEDITMGKFMDQISMISSQINLLQSQLETPSLESCNNKDERISFLKKVESYLEQLSTLKLATERQLTGGETVASCPSPFEASLKLQQISGLNLRLSDILVRLRELAGEELKVIREEMEPNLQILDIEESTEQLSCLDPAKSARKLARAVRLSRRYPEARRAELIIEELIARARDIEDELKESNRLMELVMGNSAEKDYEIILGDDNQKLFKTKKMCENRCDEENGGDCIIEPKEKSPLRKMFDFILFIVLAIGLPILFVGGVAVLIVLSKKFK